MDWEKLAICEEKFLEEYPGGFEHPDMVEIGKKHKIGKLTARAQELLQPEGFEQSEAMAENLIKTVTSSSMVSVFEKPKFRDFVRELSAIERGRLTSYFYQLLHGEMKSGFEGLVDFLSPAKLAKWTLVSVCPFYFRPEEEVFVKPTTAKNVISFFGIQGLVYKAKPSWEFYSIYRDIILEMKSRVSPLLGPDNAAFSGFLMMTMGDA